MLADATHEEDHAPHPPATLASTKRTPCPLYLLSSYLKARSNIPTTTVPNEASDPPHQQPSLSAGTACMKMLAACLKV